MKKNYVTPEIEVIEVRIEQGFASSPGGGTENPDDDGTFGDNPFGRLF